MFERTDCHSNLRRNFRTHKLVYLFFNCVHVIRRPKWFLYFHMNFTTSFAHSIAPFYAFILLYSSFRMSRMFASNRQNTAEQEKISFNKKAATFKVGLILFCPLLKWKKQCRRHRRTVPTEWREKNINARNNNIWKAFDWQPSLLLQNKNTKNLDDEQSLEPFTVNNSSTEM